MSAPVAVNQNDILLRSDSKGIVTLTLNRPEQFNALSEELLTALQTELDDIAGNKEIAAVVLGANGKAFCAGHDLKQMRKKPQEDYYQALFRQCGHMMQSITAMPQPVVARVQGMATAAGCQLVAACDLAIASDEVRFAVSGINLGLFCSTPAVALSRNISRKRAFEMLVTGKFIGTEKAMDWGLINDVVPADQLDSRIAEVTDVLLQKPLVALHTGKSMFYQQLNKSLESAYDYAGEVMACNMMEDETVEGIDAFIEKRPPSWAKD